MQNRQYREYWVRSTREQKGGLNSCSAVPSNNWHKIWACLTLAEKLSSRPSRDTDVNSETTGEGGKGVVVAESGEVTPKILLDSSLYWK